jgi:hypothetical protein
MFLPAYRTMQDDPTQFMTDLREEFETSVPIDSCATWVQVAQINFASENKTPDLFDALRKAPATPESSETKQLVSGLEPVRSSLIMLRYFGVVC